MGHDMGLTKNMLGFASMAFLLFIFLRSLLFGSRAKSCTFSKQPFNLFIFLDLVHVLFIVIYFILDYPCNVLT